MVYPRLVRSICSAALLLGLSVGSVAVAQEGTPEAETGATPVPENCTVIADGLVNPRYVAVGDDGTVYVTEAGIGGDEDIAAPEEIAEPEGTPDNPAEAVEVLEEEGTPAADEGEAEEDQADEGEAEEGGEPPLTRGLTGQVTIISPDGEQSVLVDGLASYSIGVGPAGIALGDGVVYVAVGGANALLGLDPLETENTILAIDPETGDYTVVAELGSFEIANNPDGTDVNPNLYGMALGPDGLLYVADAGGNAIYRVDPVTGEFALHVVIPTLSVIQGTEPPDDPQQDRQPVPVGVAFSPDGTLTVSLLSEAWPEGAPSILTVAPDGTLTPLVTDLSMSVGLAYGPDDNLYVSEMTTDFENFAPGDVLRVAEDGSTEVALDGLVVPHGINFDDEGNLYVVTGSLALGPDAAGQVLRCEGVAGAADEANGAADEEATPVAVFGRD